MLWSRDDRGLILAHGVVAGGRGEWCPKRGGCGMGEKSFFEALFDFSFSSFVTTKIIKLLYALAIFFSVIMVIVFIIGAFASSGVLGVLTLLVSPLLFLLYVAWARVCLEIVIVIFRIAENTGKLAEQPHAGGTVPPAPMS
jgi:hypothetical protein